MRHVALLGSTGSIGTQALDVIARHRAAFAVTVVAASGSRPELLAEQAAAFDIPAVAIADEAAVDRFRSAYRDATHGDFEPQVHAGPHAAELAAATPSDVVLNGITGSIGLRPTLAALASGAVLALANKESLIVGGSLVTDAAAPGQIVPVDSEHSALAQCLRGGRAAEVRRLLVTASGGPFRGLSRDELTAVSVEDALAHPTWSMGPVVTINSATLMNKGLEVIEAHLLFGIPFESIDVVVHPQSVVHSMVEFVDGSTIAQVSPPDMRLPIALGLTWPDRLADAAPGNDWTKPVSWDFEPLDDDAFPAVALAKRAGVAGGTAPAAFNAANEVCVEAFLAGRLPFVKIVETVEQVLALHFATPAVDHLTVDEVLAADAAAREHASGLIGDTAAVAAEPARMGATS